MDCGLLGGLLGGGLLGGGLLGGGLKLVCASAPGMKPRVVTMSAIPGTKVSREITRRRDATNAPQRTLPSDGALR